MRNGPMGNRHDVVASDLDAAYSRRNARGQSCHRKGDVDERRHGSRARIHHGTQHLLQYARTVRPQLRLDNRVTDRSDRAIGWSPTKKRCANCATSIPTISKCRPSTLSRCLAVGYATPNDTSLSKQLEAAGILEKLWKQNREPSRSRSLPDPFLRLSSVRSARPDRSPDL